MLNKIQTNSYSFRLFPSRITKHAKRTLSIALVAFAAWSPFASAEWAILPIVNAGSDDNGNVLLQFPAGSFNPCGCLVVSGSAPGAKQILALGTAAVAAGKTVYVNREHRTTAPNWGITDYATEIRLIK